MRKDYLIIGSMEAINIQRWVRDKARSPGLLSFYVRVIYDFKVI